MQFEKAFIRCCAVFHFVLRGKRGEKRKRRRPDRLVAVKRFERELTDVGHLEVTTACAGLCLCSLAPSFSTRTMDAFRADAARNIIPEKGEKAERKDLKQDRYTRERLECRPRGGLWLECRIKVRIIRYVASRTSRRNRCFIVIVNLYSSVTRFLFAACLHSVGASRASEIFAALFQRYSRVVWKMGNAVPGTCQTWETSTTKLQKYTGCFTTCLTYDTVLHANRLRNIVLGSSFFTRSFESSDINAE